MEAGDEIELSISLVEPEEPLAEVPKRKLPVLPPPGTRLRPPSRRKERQTKTRERQKQKSALSLIAEAEDEKSEKSTLESSLAKERALERRRRREKAPKVVSGDAAVIKPAHISPEVSLLKPDEIPSRESSLGQMTPEHSISMVPEPSIKEVSLVENSISVLAQPHEVMSLENSVSQVDEFASVEHSVSKVDEPVEPSISEASELSVSTMERRVREANRELSLITPDNEIDLSVSLIKDQTSILYDDEDREYERRVKAEKLFEKHVLQQAKITMGYMLDEVCEDKGPWRKFALAMDEVIDDVSEQMIEEAVYFLEQEERLNAMKSTKHTAAEERAFVRLRDEIALLKLEEPPIELFCFDVRKLPIKLDIMDPVAYDLAALQEKRKNVVFKVDSTS